MATFKDINLLTQKSALAGTEKIPVSDTEFTTPNQIAQITSPKIYMGTCPTAAATVTKVVTVEEFPLDGNGKPLVGTMIGVKFTYSNSGTAPKLNVNNTGAASIYYNDAVYSSASTIGGYAARYSYYVWHDNMWVFLSWGADNNDNTLAYNVRYNVASRTMTGATYRYRLLFSSADDAHWVAANTSTSTNATSARTVNQTPINPFGQIVYYASTSAIASGNAPEASSLYTQYSITLGYSFNRTGAALTLTARLPVYIKCAPQSNGSAIMDASTPYVQALPTTDDGKIYIYLGIASTATAVEVSIAHPVYYFKDGAIRLWTNAAASSGGINSIVMNGDAVPVSGGVADLGNLVSGAGVTAIVAISESDYEALAVKDPTTLYIVTPSTPVFPLSGSGTSADPIVGWYDNVATLVNPTGAANGNFTGTLPGIYDYFINNVTTIDGPTDYEHYRGNTAFLVGEEETYYPTVVTSGNNINIQYTEGNKLYLINTNTYQKSGTIIIYPTDVVEFNLKED